MLRALPGLALAGLALLIREPRRGSSEIKDIGTARRPGSPYRLVLGIPTMWWIIASGALHNFNMYAVGILPAGIPEPLSPCEPADGRIHLRNRDRLCRSRRDAPRRLGWVTG